MIELTILSLVLVSVVLFIASITHLEREEPRSTRKPHRYAGWFE